MPECIPVHRQRAGDSFRTKLWNHRSLLEARARTSVSCCRALNLLTVKALSVLLWVIGDAVTETRGAMRS